MNYNKMTVRDIPVRGKKVLLRCDFNVPLDKLTGKITDDKRIRAAVPTIRYLLENGAAVIACSHLGRPKGEWKPELSLRPVAERLSDLLGTPVYMAADVIGDSAKAMASALLPGEMLIIGQRTLVHDQHNIGLRNDLALNFGGNHDVAHRTTATLLGAIHGRKRNIVSCFNGSSAKDFTQVHDSLSADSGE